MKRNPIDRIVIAIAAVVSICGCIVLAFGSLYFLKITSEPTAQYFLTVDEVLDRQSEWVDRNIRISGVVIGDTIKYNESTLTLSFTIANVPADYQTVEELGGLENVLREAASDPNNPKIEVVFIGTQPELLREGAQAIAIGRLGEGGIFYAEEILLRCPPRYEESIPEQVQ